MKNILIGLFALAAVTVGAQEYKSRLPQPGELEKVAGLDYYIADGAPRFTLSQKLTGHNENYTLSDTNYYLIVWGNTSNAFVTFPNPTNYQKREFTIVTTGNSTAIFTNGATTGTFSTISNAVATSYSLTSNKVVNIVSTGTNWLVIDLR